MRFSIRTLFVVMLVVAVGFIGVREVNRRLNDIVMNPYRVESAGDLLISFMEKHDRWPADWSELQDLVESGGHKLSGVRTFQELRNNVNIDFSFDPRSYRSENGSTLRVVKAYDGTLHGATHDPNKTIQDYLLRKSQAKE